MIGRDTHDQSHKENRSSQAGNYKNKTRETKLWSEHLSESGWVNRDFILCLELMRWCGCVVNCQVREIRRPRPASYKHTHTERDRLETHMTHTGETAGKRRRQGNDPNKMLNISQNKKKFVLEDRSGKSNVTHPLWTWMTVQNACLFRYYILSWPKWWPDRLTVPCQELLAWLEITSSDGHIENDHPFQTQVMPKMECQHYF